MCRAGGPARKKLRKKIWRRKEREREKDRRVGGQKAKGRKMERHIKCARKRDFL